MIALTDVSASENKVVVTQVTLKLGAGATAVVGSPSDGTSLLLALLAGAHRPSRGLVRVLELDPSTPASRKSIGWVPRVPTLPESLSVSEALALMATIRGGSLDVAAALARFGLSGLAKARVCDLEASQARAVALAEAFASPAVRVLLIDEPFVSMEPSACTAMQAALASDRDRCVVFCTASPNDARELANGHVVLGSGRVTSVGSSNDLIDPGGVAKLVAIARDPRALVKALSEHESLLALEVRGHAVVVTAADLDAGARAINQAVLASGTSIDSLTTERG